MNRCLTFLLANWSNTITKSSTISLPILAPVHILSVCFFYLGAMFIMEADWNKKISVQSKREGYELLFIGEQLCNSATH